MVLELIDGIRTKPSDVVNSTLEGVLMILHEYDDHVVGISARLFDVVRENILRLGMLKGFRSYPEGRLTLDQVTKSLVY